MQIAFFISYATLQSKMFSFLYFSTSCFKIFVLWFSDPSRLLIAYSCTVSFGLCSGRAASPVRCNQ